MAVLVIMRNGVSALASCIFLGLSLVSVSSPNGARTDPPSGGALIGRSPDQIIELLGVPNRVSIGHSLLRFHYRGKNGKDAAVTFHADVAISVPDADFTPAAVTAPPMDRAYSGQDLRTAVLRLGTPKEIVEGATGATLDYGGGKKIMVASGRIVTGG